MPGAVKFAKAYQKIHSCIVSCKTSDQMDSCSKMIELLRKQFINPKDNADIILYRLDAIKKLCRIRNNYTETYLTRISNEPGRV